MHIRTLRCFGARPGQGNPALVVEGAAPDRATRQQLARERASTCVFLDEVDDGAIVLDFFYPHMRSPLCLHATLAAAAVLFGRRPDAGVIAVETALARQRLALSRDGGDYFVRLAQQPAPAIELTRRQVADLLGAQSVAPARTASVGSPKLLAEVADVEVLYGLSPDLDVISAWGKQHGVNGIYAWCRRADGGVEGRNFNHLDPVLEDGATGVAAGALTLALKSGLVLRQGRAVGLDCLIRTHVDGDFVLVGGAAAEA